MIDLYYQFYFYSYFKKKSENEWFGSKSKGGYGVLSVNKKPVLAHRISYWIKNGDFDTSKIIRHTCDNPICVNPSHLVIGTVQDNSIDMVERGRSTKKVSDEDVKLIRHMGKTMKSTEIARIFPLDSAHIRKILKGTKRKYVK